MVGCGSIKEVEVGDVKFTFTFYNHRGWCMAIDLGTIL
ncbi:MAG: hypothetical protein BWY19_01226 [bacterium ADurb.Bin212]|nr:MAG: hypothetical protein BWY19_01226 [bacterium ADurb.Bin212]